MFEKVYASTPHNPAGLESFRLLWRSSFATDAFAKATYPELVRRYEPKDMRLLIALIRRRILIIFISNIFFIILIMLTILIILILMIILKTLVIII